MTAMRASVLLAALLAAMTTAGRLSAQDDSAARNLQERYGIRVDLQKYPQADPQETMRSIAKAMKAGDAKYVLAHLASPSHIDKEVDGKVENLETLAKELSERDRAEEIVDAVERHLKDGQWTIREALAWSEAEGVEDVSLEKIDSRWFLHNHAVDKPEEK